MELTGRRDAEAAFPPPTSPEMVLHCVAAYGVIIRIVQMAIALRRGWLLASVDTELHQEN